MIIHVKAKRSSASRVRRVTHALEALEENSPEQKLTICDWLILLCGGLAQAAAVSGQPFATT